MKKLFSFAVTAVLTGVLAFSFAGCEKKQEPTSGFGKEVLSVGSQLDALNGLLKGDADIAVIDSVMAGYYMNSTASFADYQVLQGATLAEEEYGIAAKKGNDALMGKINEALIALANTDYKTIANKYGLGTELLVTGSTVNPLGNASDSSWQDVVTAGKLIIGYTEFAPIAYYEGDGDAKQFVGFDIDLAKAVVAYLNSTYNCNVEIEFLEIDWNSKESLLADGSIDLVWNGMTITDERIAAMAISVPYLCNKQVAIVAKKNAAKYACSSYDTFVTAVNDAIIIVEAGSAGAELASPEE